MAETTTLERTGGDDGAADNGPTALPRFEAACTVTGWLLEDGGRADGIRALLGEVSHRLVEAGLPLFRATFFLRTLHPQILASAYAWRADREVVEAFDLGHATQRSEAYLQSPIKLVNDGAPGVRRRLADPVCPRDFPILDDLEADGVTDYLVLPLVFSDGARYAATWATRAPGGFTEAHLGRIAALVPTLTMRLEVLSMRRIASNLMNTYLGPKTGARVLKGAIQRGSVETIEAAILYSDLRGFTTLTDRLPSEALLELLNGYFERLVEPIKARGGEVLKFMGDAALAIFPLAEFGDGGRASQAALEAVREAAALTAEHNRERATTGMPEIAFDVALHLGALSYGNIGAPDRLDFTVIGPAVNHAVRIEGMCRVTEQPAIASAAFAEVVPERLDSIGFHALKGVREPQELFAVPLPA